MVFGELTVLTIAGKKHGAKAECLCVCGKKVTRGLYYLKRSLKDRVRSINCGHDRGQWKVKHGWSGSKEYRAWLNMRDRCYDPKSNRYSRYGGRGIKVCDRWLGSFEAFLEDVGPAPSKFHSIDREKVDGDYEPGNVRWATPKEQANNRSNTMQYRVIAKRIILDRISTEITAENGQTYHDEPGGKASTPKQVRKLNEAREGIEASLTKKWKLGD